ncbi:MAG: recombinase RecT [Lachnospiraceae bacterium]|nr:recombinase RecT [Lachnospiraceae bacterium]
MAVQNSLVKNPPKMGITAFLNQDAVKNQLAQAVGKNSMRFVSSVVSAVTVNSALQECTNSSILSAALLGESLNLSPSPQLGQYYMVPFNNKKKGCKEAQFQMGYKGYIQLAKRSGVYKKLNAMEIKESELVRFDPLMEELEINLIEDDEIRAKAPTIGYYAMFEELNGFRKVLYWSKKKMMAHAEQYSQAFAMNGGAKSLKLLEDGKIPEKDMWKYSSFWFKNFDDMACKTMLRQLISKWGTMSIEFEKAFTNDMAVIHENGEAEYVENESEEEIIVEQPQESQETQTNAQQPPAAEQYEQQSFEQDSPADALFGNRQ